MFGVGDIWLESKLIIKILSHPWYQRTFDWFSWGWRKIFFFEKKVQNSQLIKTEFFKIANLFAKILQIGPWISRFDWCKGHRPGSTYNIESVRHNCQNSQKTLKLHFLPVFELMSDSLTTTSTTSMPFGSIKCNFQQPAFILWFAFTSKKMLSLCTFVASKSGCTVPFWCL